LNQRPFTNDPRLREVSVPVATMWTGPDAPRDIDAAAVLDLPDLSAWVSSLDEDGDDARLGLHGRTLTQLLLGEPALILEERDEWVRVAAPAQTSSAHDQGYPGWVRRAHLAAPMARTRVVGAFVVVPHAPLTLDDGSTVEVSCGTALRVEGLTDEHAALLLPGERRGTVPLDAVRLADKGQQPTYGPDDLLATARQFLGVRYLWGGTSGWGLDCSGLVHLTLRTHGVKVPRDAFDQAAAIVTVPLDEVRPGDLYFFAQPGGRVYHVGFVTRPVGEDGVRWMLHAPEGSGGTRGIEDAPMAEERLRLLVGAGRVRQPGTTRLATY